MSTPSLESVSIPVAPLGFSNCQTGTGCAPGERMNHLVRVVNGGTPGTTVCGLTRFDSKSGAHDADIPGWAMGGGGVSGLGIRQVRCSACWADGSGASA